jgi:hypothetical protein
VFLGIAVGNLGGVRLRISLEAIAEGTMAKQNLSRMDFEALVNLRKRIEATLLERRDAIEKQLGVSHR